MNWKPPERKPLNIKPTPRPSREMLAHLLESEDGQLHGETLSRDEIAMLVNELLALKYGAEVLAHAWRERRYCDPELSHRELCANELDALFRGMP